MKLPSLSPLQTNLCNYRSRLLKVHFLICSSSLNVSQLQTCCCKGTVKLLMFEKQQGFSSLMENIQICSPKLAVRGCTFPTICCEAHRCNKHCHMAKCTQLLLLSAGELRVNLPLVRLAFYKSFPETQLEKCSNNRTLLLLLLLLFLIVDLLI